MMFSSIPLYDNNVFSKLDGFWTDQMFLTFGRLERTSRFVGPESPPNPSAIIVYDRHRNAWLDPLMIYECVGVPFQILPFHEPLKFHLLCRFNSTVQKVTCAISENMQSVRVTATESLFAIHTLMDSYDSPALKVYFESGLPLFASRATYDELIIDKIHDGMAVETKRMFANRIRCVHYANRTVQFLNSSDNDQWILSTFNIDSSELTEAEGLDLGTDPYANFCFGNDKLFRHSLRDKTIYVYELAPPYANRRVCLLPLSGNINLVHSSDGQIWAHRTCIDCGCVKEIVSLWYELPSLSDIALRAIHKNLTMVAKQAVQKSDYPLLNFKLLIDFVLSPSEPIGDSPPADGSLDGCNCAFFEYMNELNQLYVDLNRDSDDDYYCISNFNFF